MGEEGYKIFIGGLSLDTTDDSLRSYFDEYGTITDAIVMRDKQEGNRSRGFGFVTFAEEMAREKVLECGRESHTIDNKKVEVKKAVPRNEMTPGSGGGSGDGYQGGRQRREVRVKKVFLGGLPQDAQKEDIIVAIEACSGEGTVSEVNIMTERGTEKPRGFGFAFLRDPNYPDDDEKAYDVVDRLIREHPYVKVMERDVEVKKAKSVDEIRTEGGGPKGGSGSSSRPSNYSSSNYPPSAFGYPREMYGAGSRPYDGRMSGYYGAGGYEAYYQQRRAADYSMGNPYAHMYDRSAGGGGYGYDSSGAASAFDYNKYYGSMMSGAYSNSSSGYGPTRGYGDYKERSGDRGDSRYNPYTRR